MIPTLAIYILIPLLSALIGWITNYMAVKMIFRPYVPKNILGVKVQGLIPRRHSDLAHSIGETIEKELLTHEDITKLIKTPAIEGKIVTLIESEIDVFLKEKLGSLPMVAMFLQGEMAQKIRDMLLSQLKDSIPNILDSMSEGLEEHINFKEIVQTKIEGFDYSKLEKIIYDIASKELKMIEVLGGVLGFLVGLVQVALLYFNAQA